MFANIMRADLYRFVRSRFLLVTAVAFAVVIGLFTPFALADPRETNFAFGGPTGGMKDGVALYDGFVGFVYANPDHPHFWELMYSATCFTAVTVFAIAITGMVITSSDDHNGITKIAVAQGQSQTVMFCSKLVLSVLVTAVLWTLHNAITLALVLHSRGASLSGAEWARWAGFCAMLYAVQFVLMLAASLVTLVTRSRVAGLAVTVVLVFGAIIGGAINSAHPRRWANWLLGTDPMWRLNRVSRSWAETGLVGETWWYVGIASVVLVGASVAWLRRRELS